MVSLAVWSAPTGGKPQRLTATPPDTEAALGSWVKADPTLVRDGLVVVAQQLIFSTRERLDLLCIEGRSRWLLVELKRDRMARDVAAQALDYVSLLAAMSADELAGRLASHLETAPRETRDLVADLLAGESDDNPRDISAVVVGTIADEPLLRITSFLTERYGVPISVVELQAFQSPSGDLLIVREETGAEESSTSNVPGTSPSSVEERWARVRTSAEQRGFGDSLIRFTSMAESAGLYVRPYSRSIMITPPGNRGRYLAVVGFVGSGANARAEISFGSHEFVEFFPALGVDQVEATLGPCAGKATPHQLVSFGQALTTLMSQSATDTE